MSSTLTGTDAMLFENAFYIGIKLQNILYGIQLVFYIKTLRILLTCRSGPRQSNVFYAIFSSVMLILITIWVFATVILGRELWILEEDYPGGPLAYVEANAPDIYMGFGTTAAIILQQMADGLMLYRCRIVWNSLRAIVLPSILWLANIALGILVVWTSSIPMTNSFSGFSAKLGLAYYSVSVFLNAALACIICYRLVCHARTVEEHLGEEHKAPYSSIVVLLVESVLPYTLSGIAFLISYGVGSQTAITFLCVYTLMMCVSPQMLILRVAEGRARQRDSTKSVPSVIIFSPGRRDTYGSNRFSGTGVGAMHLQTLPSVLPSHPELDEDADKVRV